MSEEVQAIGWEAIDKEMERLYGDQVPKHYGTMLPYSLGGPDPLEGISAYVKNEPVPHWHIVTYGFSDLYEKESKDPEYSGYGFELTFRLVKQPNEQEPPAWSLNFLQNLGRYIFSSGNYFQAGHYLNTNGPIALESDTLIQSIAFIEDPMLPPISTPNGRVEFLQVVGITVDEREAMEMWNTLGLLEAASSHLPLYITDLSRESFMNDPAIKEALQSGMHKDGSSTGSLFLDNLDWTEKKSLFKKTTYTITIGAKQAPLIAQILNGRIPKNKDLQLIGRNLSIVFSPTEQTNVDITDNQVKLYINQECVNELMEVLVPHVGVYPLNSFKGLAFNIVKSEIKDSKGNVVETIG